VQHLWKGILVLEPRVAESLGLPRPPPEHDAAEPPPGIPKAYNTWVVVPSGHVLAHLANLPASEVKKYGFTAYQLSLPNRTRIPFILMDLWTLRSYANHTCSNAILKIDQDRVSIPDVFIELCPLSKETWLNSCMAGQHFQIGRVSFKLVLTYTLFPKNFRTDDRIVCALSEGFPRMSMDMRMKLDTSEGDQPRLIAKKEQDDTAKQEQRAAAKMKVDPELQQHENDFVGNQLPWGQ
jgi:hypothetical protein